jgi:hypothetical protein
MISKEKIFFDPTDANTVADSDSIGAFVRAGSDGDLIASQTINAEEWLNVASVLHDDSGAVINGSNPLPVSITSGVNVEVDLSHVDDSVALGDGTNLLTSTTVGADIGLDVNIINASIVVSATDFDIRDLVYTSDSVTAYQGTSPWVVSATDLDIRDLTAASDSVAAWLSDGSGNAITSSGGALDVNLASQDADINVNITNASLSVTQGTSPWVVSATDLDIRDLTHVSDSVKLGDGTNLLTSTNVGSDYGLDVYQLNDPTVANVAALTTAKSATSTQSALLASQLSNRKFMLVQNLGNRAVYVAEAGATDAATTGLRLSPGAVAEFRLGASVALDVEASDGTQDVRVFEAS